MSGPTRPPDVARGGSARSRSRAAARRARGRRAATRRGAEALGLGDAIWLAEPGKQADVIVLDAGAPLFRAERARRSVHDDRLRDAPGHVRLTMVAGRIPIAMARGRRSTIAS
jgi:cytosine/adenosine deaminase-related metal-dependent hydrolase